MDFTFELAKPEDDLDIRRLLASSAMPGRITVTFEREPNYFLGCATMGPFYQVILIRHQSDREIAGIVCRACRSHFVNGQIEEVGYIGQVRIAEKYQGLWLLARGLPFFRQLHADGRAAAYWGVISDENRVARGVMVERARRSFPQAHQVARIYTLGIILQRSQRRRALPGPAGTDCLIERASPQELEKIVAFLRREGAQKQLFPAYTLDDFNCSPVTRGFDGRDFVIARRRLINQPGDQIVGVMGLWDQSAYKQSVVQTYSGYLRWLRPAYNLVAPLIGVQPLPGRGQHIHSAYASFICIADDDPHIFRALLQATYNLAAERRYAYLMLGLTEHDPLLPVARQYPHIAYHSQLYIASWEEKSIYQRLDGRVPYVEIAAL